MLLLIGAYGLGRVHEARVGGAALAEYQSKQLGNTVRTVEKQVVVQKEVEVKYVARIRKIYVKGETTEKSIPQYITAVDVDRYGVNAGFARVIDADWTSDAIGPAVDSDGEPAGIQIDDVAVVQASNNTACRAWREQVYGWREFYAKQQIAINGQAGEWARTPPTGEE